MDYLTSTTETKSVQSWVRWSVCVHIGSQVTSERRDLKHLHHLKPDQGQLVFTYLLLWFVLPVPRMRTFSLSGEVSDGYFASEEVKTEDL